MLYSCDGPFVFGPKINKVCCHGWNRQHFLTSREANRTQQLIDCGVIIPPDGTQRITEIEEE